MKTENSEVKPESYLGQRIGLAVVVILAVVIWLKWPSLENVEAASFATLEVVDKHEWLMNYRSSDVALDLNSRIKEALKDKVDSPEITINNDCCLVSSASVVAPGRGEMESIGKLTAKNVSYRYKVDFILTDTRQEILEIQIHPL